VRDREIFNEVRSMGEGQRSVQLAEQCITYALTLRSLAQPLPLSTPH
jgi:hypothetical protein